jgi:hypothetical protein
MNRAKLLKLIQGYIGMKPKDVGCDNWNKMQEKMADEIMRLAADKKNLPDNCLAQDGSTCLFDVNSCKKCEL